LAVDHINFEVRQGEVFGFLGPKGAGKTTTQRMLTTLLEPTEGHIVIFDHDLARETYPVKRQMGLVIEESNVYTELTAWDNLMFTARMDADIFTSDCSCCSIRSRTARAASRGVLTLV